MSVPDAFCWTRFGTEAGESIDEIFARKEDERCENQGTFLWGVGNSIRPSLHALISERREAVVVFSPMRGKPSAHDVAPAHTVLWTAATTLRGEPYAIPDGSVVTSGRRSQSARNHHYALVCASDAPLNCLSESELIRLPEMRNFRNGTSIGASQVTCVVRHTPANGDSGPTYSVALTARLVWPYFVTLSDPVEVPDDIRDLDTECNGPGAMRRALLDLRRRADRPFQTSLSLAAAR
jgi:hypothetical protein